MTDESKPKKDEDIWEAFERILSEYPPLTGDDAIIQITKAELAEREKAAAEHAYKYLCDNWQDRDMEDFPKYWQSRGGK